MLTEKEYKEIYEEALVLMKEEDSLNSLQKAINKLKEIPKEILDVSSKLGECKERYVVYEKYFLAKNMSCQDVIEEIDKAIVLFTECIDYKDSAELKVFCENKRKELLRIENEEKEKVYQESKQLFKTNELANVEKAIENIRFINGYKDSELLYKTWGLQRKELLYRRAISLLQNKTQENIKLAIVDLLKIKGYKNADVLLKEAQMDRDRLVIDEIEKRKHYKYIVMFASLSVIALVIIIVSLI